VAERRARHAEKHDKFRDRNCTLKFRIKTTGGFNLAMAIIREPAIYQLLQHLRSRPFPSR
jgi:hypothetical protein